MDYTKIKPKYLERLNKLIQEPPIQLPKSFISETRKIVHELAYEAWDAGHEEGYNAKTEEIES